MGYSAYDKEITIGLYGDYNVDEVIAYFTNNQSGKVIFSNEEDKYYYYEIVEQINFEKLIRFKTAVVKMHIQPFKYSSVEGAMTFSITDETSIDITNNGNYISKPIISIIGSGTIELILNDIQLFTIELGETPTPITIDIENMNAYNPTTDVFMNRLVTGDYNNFVLSVGRNVISWTGDITQISLDNYSRWI